MNSNWQVGIDVGGTFTDVVATNSVNDQTRCAKVATRTDDRIAGLITALAAVDLRWEDVADLIHGTTMVTNAIVEDRLARVALISTRGFSDSVEIGRQNRRYLYRLDLPPKLTPQVPAERRFEVVERLDYQGQVLRQLDEESVDDVIQQCRDCGAEAVAVSLLHAYANPQHEARLGQRLSEIFPYVSLSNRVNPEAREYERTATTVLSASVMPLAAGYLDRLEEAKPQRSRLHLFHSAGGMASPQALRDLPLGLALSGPSAGVAAAGHIADVLGIEQAISFDMGGTTTDVCLITEGRAQVSTERSLAGRPLCQPMVSIDSIGPARAALAPLAASMKISIEQTALGICRVANSAMVRALRRSTVEKGIDGRQCTLIAFGCAGPMHAAEVARAFEISRLLVPVHSSVFSALGCVSAQFSYSQQQSLRMPLLDWDRDKLNAARERLQQRLIQPLLAAGHNAVDVRLEEVASIRYSGQSYAIELFDPNFDDPAALGLTFLAQHQKLYGFANEAPWELVAIRQRASVSRPSVCTVVPLSDNPESVEPITTDCVFDSSGFVATPRFDRTALITGQQISGPAIIEDAWSTVVVPPLASLNVDATGNLHIELGATP